MIFELGKVITGFVLQVLHTMYPLWKKSIYKGFDFILIRIGGGFMAKYKIEQDHDGCIGCGACVAVCPENWEMKDDNKSAPKKTEISEDEFECNNNAATGCPVSVIHIINEETKEKII